MSEQTPQSTQSAPRLLRVREVAARLDVPRARAYQLVRENKLPGVVRIGRQVRVNPDELEAWIQKGGDPDS